MARPCRIRSWRAAGPPCGGGEGRLNTHFVGSQKLSVQPLLPLLLPELGRQALGAAGLAAPGNLRPPFGPRRRSPRRLRSPRQGPRRPCALACDGPLAASRAAAVFRPASGSRRARFPLRGMRRNAAPSVPRNLDPAFAGKHLLSPRDILSALFEILSPRAAGGAKAGVGGSMPGNGLCAHGRGNAPRLCRAASGRSAKKYFLCPDAFEVRNPESPAARRPGHALQDPPRRSKAHEAKRRAQRGPNRRRPRESAPPFMKMRKRRSGLQVAERGGRRAGSACRPAAISTPVPFGAAMPHGGSPPLPSPRPAAARTPAPLA